MEEEKKQIIFFEEPGVYKSSDYLTEINEALAKGNTKEYIFQILLRSLFGEYIFLMNKRKTEKSVYATIEEINTKYNAIVKKNKELNFAKNAFKEFMKIVGAQLKKKMEEKENVPKSEINENINNENIVEN